MTNQADKDSKIIIDNDQATFEKLMTLCNFYSKTFKEYNKILHLLQALPRVDGKITLDENVFSIIGCYLEDYEGLNAYAHKMMQKETTLH